MVYSNTAVCIAVIGKTDIQPVFNYILLQNYNVCRSAVCIDIGAVRLVVDHLGLRLKYIEYTLGKR